MTLRKFTTKFIKYSLMYLSVMLVVGGYFMFGNLNYESMVVINLGIIFGLTFFPLGLLTILLSLIILLTGNLTKLVKFAIIVVSILFLYLVLPVGESFVSIANKTGNDTYCKLAKGYKYKCVATTELSNALQVEYDCKTTTSCNGPQCLSHTTCGSGGAFGGCPMVSNCAVDQAWLCEATGGSHSEDMGAEPSLVRKAGGSRFCSCPANEVFLTDYGCSDCNSFTHEETKKWCTNASRF